MKAPRGSCPQEIIPLVISYLRRLEQKGVRSLYVDAAGPSTKDAGEAMSVAGKTVEALLGELESRVSVCTACGLHEGRTQAVFGKGNPRTAVMFIGEGPGRDEDLKGEPFVGRSGQLLTKILAAIDLERQDVYITNIVKCRPPQNRDPVEDEVRRCERYLIEQIEIIKPRLICALGRIAAQWLLDTKEPLTSLRGADNYYQGIPVLVTYHPAALLRNPELKRGAWEDFKKLKGLIAEGGEE
jgi:uracil-DNA glycosylase family 4